MLNLISKRLLIACSLTLSLSSCYTSKIYIVRHAERLNQTEDTPLSEAGLQRAKVLADNLNDEKIDSIFVTKYQRNRQTAQPLADRLGKSPVIYEPKPNSIIVDRLKRLKGKNALVVGHSDTIIEIAQGLGTKPSLSKIESSDYDNLFFIMLKKRLFGKSTTLIESTYGEKTLP
ncbi:MAG: phosphoglycerate mutase family protein [Spirosomataceae bacterium]